MSGLDDVTPEEWNTMAELQRSKRAEEQWNLYRKQEKNLIEDDDMVDNPAHYNEGAIETIDYIVDVLGEWDSIHYCHGNIIKYLSTRLWTKGKPLQDAKKARWYLNKMIDLMEKTEGEHW